MHAWILPHWEQTPHPRTRHQPPGQDPPTPDQAPPSREHTHPPRVPTRSRPPPPGAEPLPGSRLQHTVNKRPVRILLECILVYNAFVPIDTSYNASHNQDHWLIRTPYLSIKASNVILACFCLKRIVPMF